MLKTLSRRSALKTLVAAGAFATGKLPRLNAALDEPAGLHDPLRPGFHYLSPRGWMNDPCAPVFWQGEYHLFHQYNPHAAVWGDMHWFHATSPDLVHWTRRGVALAPIPGSPDAEGCFTGSAIVHGTGKDAKLAILYTGVQTAPQAQATLDDGTHLFRETQILATPANDRLDAWIRMPGGPVIPAPPPGMHVTGFRDPAPFQIPGRPDLWYTLVGSGIRGVGGNVLLYSSPDLLKWTYLHPLAQGTWSGDPGSGHDPVDSGEMWECPDFFLLDADGRAAGDTWVLIHSTERKTLWHTGKLDAKTLLFHVEKTGELDFGRDNLANGGKGQGTFYAPKSQLDQDGRRILWGWLPETRPEAEYAKAGWAGMMSLPRELRLGPDGVLLQRPAKALEALREPNGIGVGWGSWSHMHYAMDGDTHEILITLNVFHAGPPTFTGGTVHISDHAGALFELAFSKEARTTSVRINDREIPLARPIGSNAQLRIFFDRSVAELFLDDQIAFTHRFYERSGSAPTIRLLLSPELSSHDQTLFRISPIWPA